jgi:ATP-dependent Clp protease adaptor protein ClpS
MATATITEHQTQTDKKAEYCPMWKLIYHNDDKTPMAYVVYTLKRYCNLSEDDAIEVMWAANDNGKAVAGRFSKEQAEFKRDQIISDARGKGWPLCVTIEKD